MKRVRREYAKGLSKLVYGASSKWQTVMRRRGISDEMMILVMEKMRDQIMEALDDKNKTQNAGQDLPQYASGTEDGQD